MIDVTYRVTKPWRTQAVDIWVWCENHCVGWFSPPSDHAIVDPGNRKQIQFELERDAMMFALTWC